MKQKIDHKLNEFLLTQGFSSLKYIEGRGLCGIKDFMFTVAICYGINEVGFNGRYCYPKEYRKDAILAFSIWDGNEDPIGNWIKHKGLSGEYGNCNLKIK